ncbi:MAG: hypothetical protein ABSA93_21000 [Streptosporangiaceae bacterium]
MTVDPSCPRTPSGSGRCPARSQPTRAAHRRSGAGGGQRGRVVDPVPGQQHLATGALQFPNGAYLVLRQQPGPHVGDPGLRR